MTSTSILTDIELNAVAGGSIFSEIAAAGLRGAVEGVSGGGAPNFGSVYTGPKTSGPKPCNSNHNGVHY